MFKGHERLAWMLIVVGIALVACGCASTRPFTESDRHVFEADLPNLQFYLSQTTLLSRSMESASAGVAPDHVIHTYSGKEVEEILIKKSTPGILIEMDADALLISFEPPVGGTERTFRFIVGNDGLYYMQVHPDTQARSISLVEYCGLDYRLGTYAEKSRKRTISSDPPGRLRSDNFTTSERPHLEVISKHLDELMRRRRELPGRVLP